MPSNFPTGLDSFTNPAPTSPLTNPPHSGQHGSVNDAVEALEVKVGINGSADTNSLDYKVTAASAAAAAAAAAASSASSGESAHFGFKAWNWDILDTGVSGAVPTSGTLQLVRLMVPASTLSNIHVAVGTAGTVTGVYGALYTSTGTLLVQSSNAASGWSTGLRALALTAPTAVDAGPIYVAFWMVGSATQFFRHGLISSNTDFRFNGNLAAPNLRFAVANTGLTATAPASLGTMTGTGAGNWWVAVS